MIFTGLSKDSEKGVFLCREEGNAAWDQKNDGNFGHLPQYMRSTLSGTNINRQSSGYISHAARSCITKLPAI